MAVTSDFTIFHPGLFLGAATFFHSLAVLDMIIVQHALELTFYSETSFIGPPLGPTISGPISEVALLMKTSVINPALNKVALLSRFQQINTWL